MSHSRTPNEDAVKGDQGKEQAQKIGGLILDNDSLREVWNDHGAAQGEDVRGVGGFQADRFAGVVDGIGNVSEASVELGCEEERGGGGFGGG